jgi:hypothetical protein
MEAMGKRSFGDEAEALLGVALPIAAMEKQQCRGLGATRSKEIEPCPRRTAIGQIEMIRHAGAERLAAAYPIGEVSVAIGHLIELPRRNEDRPDRERLALRFEEFRRSA